ncbi:hypothetical protein D3C77_555630 [compost metagenome]
MRLEILEQGPDFLGQCMRVASAQADRVGTGLQDDLVFGRYVEAVRVVIEGRAGIDAVGNFGWVIIGRPNGQ